MPKREQKPLHSAPRRFDRTFTLWAGLALAGVVAAYVNHFHNGFHFDDFHTITDNPAVRNLSNVPRFFTDGRSFSVLAENQGWRPLVSTTLAFDYWMAGGYERLFWFHLSTLVAFLLLLAFAFVLFSTVLDRARFGDLPPGGLDTPYVALFAAAVYGLHPVCAETVNYVIQRADVYVALGLVASLALFAAVPFARRWGLYLIPFLMGVMAKPTALIFPFLVLVWLLLFEDAPLRRRLLAVVPSLVAAVGMALVHKWMTPPTYVFGGADPFGYRITQPFVALHTVRSFFLPTQLSADSDWSPCHSLAEPAVVVGFAFVLIVFAAIALTVRPRRLRPIAFGLIWFVVTFLPTALVPLAEITNDHRMLLPLVGVTLAAVWGLALQVEHWRLPPRVVTIAAIAVLVVLGVATHVRNQAWATERTLWADVVEKSPHNGRGWMNYGLTFMRVGQYDQALQCFNRALEFTPNYSQLEINLGIAYGETGPSEEAEQHFRRALQLDATSARPQFYFARWLNKRKRDLDAVGYLRDGLRRNPYSLDARDLLMEIYHKQHNWTALQALVEDTRRVTPDDTMVNVYATMLANERGGDVAAAEKAVGRSPTPDAWLDLSVAYHKAGRYDDCINASQKALELRPDFPEAWNNIAAADLDLGRWDAAIQAADRALELRPDFPLARNNRAYAEAQKKAGAH